MNQNYTKKSTKRIQNKRLQKALNLNLAKTAMNNGSAYTHKQTK